MQPHSTGDFCTFCRSCFSLLAAPLPSNTCNDSQRSILVQLMIANFKEARTPMHKLHSISIFCTCISSRSEKSEKVNSPVSSCRRNITPALPCPLLTKSVLRQLTLKMRSAWQTILAERSHRTLKPTQRVSPPFPCHSRVTAATSGNGCICNCPGCADASATKRATQNDALSDRVHFL